MADPPPDTAAALATIAHELARLAARVAELAPTVGPLDRSSTEPPANGTASRLLEVAEVVERLGLPKQRIYALAREGRIGGVVRIGRQLRFDAEGLEAWILSGGATGDAMLGGREGGRA